VIALHEPLLIVLIKQHHLLPHVAAPLVRCRRVAPKVYVRHPAFDEHKFKILFGAVRLVSNHRLNRETLRGRFQQRRELRAIRAVRVRDFHGRDDVRLDATHNVRLHPILAVNFVRNFLAVHRAGVRPLSLCPLLSDACREARRVNGEVPFDSLQRQGRLYDQPLEIRRQRLSLKVVTDAVEVRRASDETSSLRLSNIRDEAAARELRIDLEGRAENHVAQGQARTPHALRRLYDSARQFIKQLKKSSYLVRRREIVSVPLLTIGGLWSGWRQYVAALASQLKFYGVQVLALPCILFEVGARTGVLEEVNGVITEAGL